MSPDRLSKRRLLCRVLRRGLLLAVSLCGARAQTTQTIAPPLLTPTSIVFDPNGLLYIVETNGHRVDRLDASGALTPVAGNGTQGFAGDGGPATSAQLDSPQAIALDSSGNLYLADTHNHRIRRVAIGTGVITTIAGTGLPGFSGDGGPATSARLAFPTALALDQIGNLYVADSGNERIRKLTLATGILTTVAGIGIQGNSGDGGPATSAAIDTPSGLAVDSAGNLYLADLHNQRIRRVAPDTGIITSLAPNTPLRLPRGLTLDTAGDLFVAESGGHRILRISSSGTVTALAGTGAEGFAGDNGPATAALLDGPHAVTLSPAGLLTLADTANQRIRQVDAAGVIHTMASSAPTPTLAPTALVLTSSASVQYGTGTLIATLTVQTAASGSISFSDVANGSATPLGTSPLVFDTAIFSTVNLLAGTHTIVATYTGDPTHASVTSNPSPLTVTPAPATATAEALSVLYGQAIPTPSGTLSGVLPRDQNLVTAVFTAPAKLLSPVGTYPIDASLSGPGAANYKLTVAPATLSIRQAPTVTTAQATPGTLVAGGTLTLFAKAASTTLGTPTGHITFLNTGTAIGSSVADNSGGALLTTNLAAGTYALTALYAGDANFLPSTSPAITELVLPAVGTLPDFALSATGGTSQTVPAGSAATYAFKVNVENGPLNSPILLAASGMPQGGAATFSPNSLPPGGAVSSFTLSIQTPKTTAHNRMAPSGLGLAMCVFTVVLGKRRRWSSGRLPILLWTALAGFSMLQGCGGTSGSELPKPATPSVSYPMTITATTTLPNGSTLQHTASVTLIVQ